MQRALIFLSLSFSLYLSSITGENMTSTASPQNSRSDSWTSVEEIFLKESGRQKSYPNEKIRVIQTSNVCMLGKLTSLQFIQWAENNPEGVIALPTGKSPELFIKFLHYYKKHWKEEKVQEELKQYGISQESFPETSRMKFVQLDEFFPIDTTHKNSFTHYIKQHYLSFFNINEENALTIDLSQQGVLKERGIQQIFPNGKPDLSLLSRRAKSPLEELQKRALEEAVTFCRDYEEKIHEWGGIGFFLGGIGPDGHIAFNMKGSTPLSKTRLVQMNYPSAAQAAVALGGIEYSRDKCAITIGLNTITYNPNALIIIIAAGEGKAKVVAQAIQEKPSPDYPGSFLQHHRGSRFYLTDGAAIALEDRKVEDIEKEINFASEKIDEIIFELALKQNKKIRDLTTEDFKAFRRSKRLMEKSTEKIATLLQKSEKRLINRIEKGTSLPKEKQIFHTAPHHDDIMLSYHPIMGSLLKNNSNNFVYVTSGFNAVTDDYILTLLKNCEETLLNDFGEVVLEESYKGLLEQFLERAAAQDLASIEYIESLILLKALCDTYHVNEIRPLQEKVRWLRKEYFPNKLPGDKDILEVQLLKGAMRESEADRLWALQNVDLDHIYHMRSKFYTGDYFTPLPTIADDAAPILSLYDAHNPDIITVAVDPEGTGPNTHYKVLQVVAQALRMKSENFSPKIWGYRNVWYRFSLAETNLMIPVSEENLENMNSAFISCFSTQRDASFPSPEYDGPFSQWSYETQCNQKKNLETLLGKEFFTQHNNPIIKEAKGFLFLKEMSKEEFLLSAEDLQSRMELYSL